MVPWPAPINGRRPVGNTIRALLEIVWVVSMGWSPHWLVLRGPTAGTIRRPKAANPEGTILLLFVSSFGNNKTSLVLAGGTGDGRFATGSDVRFVLEKQAFPSLSGRKVTHTISRRATIRNTCPPTRVPR